MRFSIAIGGAVEPPAAHTFERASLCHLDDAPTVRSSLLDRSVNVSPGFEWVNPVLSSFEDWVLGWVIQTGLLLLSSF